MEVQPDLLTPPSVRKSRDGAMDSYDSPYHPLSPLAVAAGRVGAIPMAFAVGAAGGKLRILGGTVSAASAEGTLSAKLVLSELVEALAYDVDQPPSATSDCVNRQSDSLSPAERFSLVDLDGDGYDDLVFSDGGRVRLKGDAESPYGLYPGLVVVLRGDGTGKFSRVSPPDLRGRSFAKATLPNGRPGLAVLRAGKVVFYTFTNGEFGAAPAADVTLEDPNGRSLEVGDFDGDGLDDLAVLGGGVLKIYAGERAGSRDGG